MVDGNDEILAEEGLQLTEEQKIAKVDCMDKDLTAEQEDFIIESGLEDIRLEREGESI